MIIKSKKVFPPNATSDLLVTSAVKMLKKKSDILDLGCGTGVLGIGALILGARRVCFIDNDKEAIDIAKINIPKIYLFC